MNGRTFLALCDQDAGPLDDLPQFDGLGSVVPGDEETFARPKLHQHRLDPGREHMDMF